MINKKSLLFIVIAIQALSLQAQSLLSYFEGDVFVERETEQISAEFGMELFEGDLVNTELSSLAILELDHGRTVKLREDSSLLLENLSRKTSVELKSGSVFSKVDRLMNGQFNVHTESVVAGVRGTEFFMAFGETIDEKADLWLCVNEGTVEVSLTESGETVLVNEGEGINIPGSTTLTKPEAYAWTKNLNWNSDPSQGDVRDTTDLKDVYSDLLDQDYF
jgi:FecR protein